MIEANDQPVQNTDYLQRYACKKIKYVTTLCLNLLLNVPKITLLCLH